MASSGRDFDPRTRAFSDEELKPQPMIKKSRKQVSIHTIVNILFACSRSIYNLQNDKDKSNSNNNFLEWCNWICINFHLRLQFVPDDLKDDKYWARRRKNNMAAKRSRDARRMKENQIALRAGFLEKEVSFPWIGKPVYRLYVVQFNDC